MYSNRKMKAVYVAGAMNADNILGVLGNISRGIHLGARVLQLGYAPFVPHLDVFFKMMMGESYDVPLSYYYDYTMEFLRRCDIVLVCPKSENSTGTQAEIKEAIRLGIPVVYSINDLRDITYIEGIATSEYKEV